MLMQQKGSAWQILATQGPQEAESFSPIWQMSCGQSAPPQAP